MPDVAFFLGRFHVLALHLPVGIVVAAVALDWLSRRERHTALARAAPFLWGAAAVSAVLTVVLGYLHFAEGGFVGPAASAHRLYGTATAVAAIAAWWLAARGSGGAGIARLATGVLVLGLVSATGHYGGHLTHGTTYLTEYAPRFLGGGERRPLEALVAEEIGLAAAGAEERRTAASIDPALVQRLLNSGLLVRAVSLDDPHLVIGLRSPGTVLSAGSFAALAEAAPFIVDLNLAGADVDDDELALLGPLPVVTHLRLARNRLSDRALGPLAALPRLEHLNLYGNSKVTDDGLEKLAAAPSLRELYLWQTAVTNESAARLRERRPALVVDLGSAAPAPAPNER